MNYFFYRFVNFRSLCLYFKKFHLQSQSRITSMRIKWRGIARASVIKWQGRTAEDYTTYSDARVITTDSRIPLVIPSSNVVAPKSTCRYWELIFSKVNKRLLSKPGTRGIHGWWVLRCQVSSEFSFKERAKRCEAFKE